MSLIEFHTQKNCDHFMSVEADHFWLRMYGCYRPSASGTRIYVTPRFLRLLDSEHNRKALFSRVFLDSVGKPIYVPYEPYPEVQPLPLPPDQQPQPEPQPQPQPEPEPDQQPEPEPVQDGSGQSWKQEPASIKGSCGLSTLLRRCFHLL
ncbi:MAG: hypothetical protein ACYCOU_02830 [Sulfobacillus sp.]